MNGDIERKQRLTVLIASIGRPSLLRTLDSVDAAIVPDTCVVDIVVVDDSPDRRVNPLLEGRKGRHPLRVIELASRNVAKARNALLDAATGDWGLFVDDDEYVDVNWIAGHLRAAAEFEADVVFCPVHFVYPQSTPGWFRKANLLWQDLGWSDNGRQVQEGATGNTLMRMELIRSLGLRFDPQFGKSGGEDTDFFSRMAKQGGKLVLSDWAIAWEHVSPSRANPAYVMERSARTGQTFAMRALRGASRLRRWAFAANALAKLAIAGVASLVAWPFDRAWRCRFQAMAWSNIGKLRTVFGHSESDGWASEIN